MKCVFCGVFFPGLPSLEHIDNCAVRWWAVRGHTLVTIPGGGSYHPLDGSNVCHKCSGVW